MASARAPRAKRARDDIAASLNENEVTWWWELADSSKYIN